MSIKISKPECIWKSRSTLGEGVLWVASLNSIFFVDIKKKQILTLNYKTKKKKIFKLNKEIGFISQIKDNIFILGLKSELRIVNIKNFETLFSKNIELNKPNNRINDGKVDPIGRLWFGTMDNLEKKQSGSLYCLDSDLRLKKVDDNYFITNGPAFLNKNNFYHTDSRKKTIYKIKLPAKNITSCTFGGPKNNHLFISTALKDMNDKEIKKYPLSGSLFKMRTNIKGKSTQSFKLSS